MKLFRLIIFLFIFSATSISGREWNFTEIDEFVESVLQSYGRPAVTIAIVELDQNDKIIQKYANAYGRIDPVCKENCEPPTNETRFCIGSLTKQFTSGLVGTALKQSKNFADSTWDTKLTAILGDEGKFFDGNSPAELATVRDILAHRMGIPRNDGGWLFGLAKSHQEIVSNIHTLKSFDPSKAWRSSFMYNNWMYSLAGYVVERLNGAAWEDLVQKYYLTPLGMENSKFIHKVGSDFDGFAQVALQLPDGSWSSVPLWQIGNITAALAPAGSICASSSDFVKYMKFLLTQNLTNFDADHQLLLKTIHEAWQPSNDIQSQNQGTPTIVNEEPTYGFGWFQGVWRDYRYVAHEGGIQGYFSNVRIFPDARVGIFASTTNSIIEPNDVTNMFEDWLTDYVLGYDVTQTKDTGRKQYTEKSFSNLNPSPSKLDVTFTFNCNITQADAQPYVGIYEHPFFSPATVSFANGTLRWAYGYFGRGSLCKTTPNTDLKPDDFRMKFDDDTTYYVINDPMSNIGVGAVFMFNRSSASLDFAMIEPLLPPNFVKGGVQTTTTSTTKATSTNSTTTTGAAATFYYNSAFMLFIASISRLIQF